MDVAKEVIGLFSANASTDLAGNPANDSQTGGNFSLGPWSLPSSVLDSGNSTNVTAVLSTTNDLASSIYIDGCVLVGGLIVWKAMRLLRITGPPRSRRGDEPSLCSRAGLQSTVGRNYICFLKHCRDTFIALTVMSAATIVPYWGLAPLGVGLLGPQLSTTNSLDETGLAILCIDTALRGLVALVFMERLQRKIQKPVLSDSTTDRIHRTLWLSDLPVYDRETLRPFEFKGEDFQQVAQDLETAINKEFKSRWTAGEYVPADMQVHVAPVVDHWHEVSLRLRTAQERLEAYRDLAKAQRKGCCGCLERSWFSRQYRLHSAQAQALETELKKIENGPKRISGTAFITFGNPKHRDYFLQNRPRCWQLQDHTYFGFGRPPFASATLACRRAPHPDDVNWTNLHVTKFHQRFWLIFLTVLLFVFMVFLVTPLAITSQLQIIIDKVESRMERFATKTHSQYVVDILNHLKGVWVKKITNQAPAVILVVINSLLLPEIIYRISMHTKPHRKSTVEVIQLHLNAFFLILNSLVIPFLEMNSISALMQWAEDRVSKHPAALVGTILRHLAQTMMHSPGIFALRYIVNCACLTNMNSLLQIPQLLCRAHARRSARTAREHVESEEAWVFAWGYWYAWTISIFTMGICMSSAVPSALPCAALFFTVQHVVDRYNLTYRIYAHGPDIETENLLTTRVLHYMRCTVAAWWFIMGSVFLLLLRTKFTPATWESTVPVDWVHGLSAGLVVASVLLVIFSWYTQMSILHDNQFQNVNISERGLSSTGGGVLQPLFSSIEQCLRCECCRPSRPAYSSVEGRGPLDRAESTFTEVLDSSPLQRINSLLSESEEVEAEGLLSWDARSVVIQPVARCNPL